MSEQPGQSEVLMLQVIEQVEKRILDRETKRFRLLYGLVALVSFIGIGVISQLIELYATRAVEQRLESSRLELDSARTYTQLLALATKLDLSNSFTKADRDSTMRLLEMAAPNKKLRSEPAFESLLEKILDSFAAASSDIFVSRIYDIYEHECLASDGITEALAQHYARRILGATDRLSETFSSDVKRFDRVVDAVDTFGNKGLVAGLRSLVMFQRNGGKRTTELDFAVASYSALDSSDRVILLRVIKRYSDVNEMVQKDASADIIRISMVGKEFSSTYAEQLEKLKKEVSQ